jgi:NAD(P)-dependent dehydrogenase (short-subunit alcohol dehydrogenase family)
MNKQLENKVAIITGGSGSIGLITAKLFLEEGAKVMLVDQNEEKLKVAISDLNSDQVKFCVTDVSQAKDVERYVSQTIEQFGKIDIFFNNAGIEGVVKPIVEYPEDVFDKVIAVNVKGSWLGNKLVIPKMTEGGSIIMTSSVAGLQGFAGLGAYVASKHAIVGIMKTSAIEAAGKKIRVNSVHPAPVNNRMMRSIEAGASADHSDEVKKQFEASIPLKRYAEPMEIAQLVLFLASDNSQFITGATMVIDGGLSAQ